MKLNVAQQELSFGTNILDLAVPDALRSKVKSGVEYFDAALGGEGFTPSQGPSSSPAARARARRR